MWSSSSSSSPGGSGAGGVSGGAHATGYSSVPTHATGYSSVPSVGAARPEFIPPNLAAGQPGQGGSPGSASGSVNSMHMGKLPPVTGKCILIFCKFFLNLST